MRNLLSAYFAKLIKDRFFLLVEGCIMLWAVYVFWAARRDFIWGTDHISTNFNTNPYFFNIVIWIGLSLAACSAVFVGTEYHDGILRNQIISGHKRSDIYLAHYLIILLAGILQAAAFFGILMLADGLFLGFFIIRLLVRPWEYLLLLFLGLLGYSALFSCFSILLTNKTLIVSAQVLLVFLMLFFGFATVNSLLEPETVLETNSYYGENKMKPNPKYLSGAERELYEWADAIVPSSMILHGVMTEVKDGLPFSMKIPIGTTLLTVCFTGGGLYGFTKKDIK